MTGSVCLATSYMFKDITISCIDLHIDDLDRWFVIELNAERCSKNEKAMAQHDNTSCVS